MLIACGEPNVVRKCEAKQIQEKENILPLLESFQMRIEDKKQMEKSTFFPFSAGYSFPDKRVCSCLSR